MMPAACEGQAGKAIRATCDATCDPVRTEVLAGARDERHLRELRGLLARATSIPTLPTDFEDAAGWYRTCRRNGDTVDFDVLARHAPLRPVAT